MTVIRLANLKISFSNFALSEAGASGVMFYSALQQLAKRAYE
jgi:hypothetical protein